MDRIDDVLMPSLGDNYIRFNRFKDNDGYYLYFHTDTNRWYYRMQFLTLKRISREFNLTEAEQILLSLKYG